MYLLCLVLPLVLGFIMDLLFGDPRRLYHPVRLIGRLITWEETQLRRRLPATPQGERAGGVILAVTVPLLSFLAPALALWGAWRVHPALWLCLETFWCWQILAAGSLRKESMAVYHKLAGGDLPAARLALSWIVGRDTGQLSEEEVSRGAIETIAENTTDGVVAPLCFLLLGGAPLGFCYKAVNTLDSMVGYKNKRYLYFGRASARLDDALGFLPARLAGWLMVTASAFGPFSAREAACIYRRDRLGHPSPNSAHTEAACAGAMGIRLGGESAYNGVVSRKPYLGEAKRNITREDIPLANRLMLQTSVLCWGLAVAGRALLSVLF